MLLLNYTNSCANYKSQGHGQLELWDSVDESKLIHDTTKFGYFQILINHPELDKKIGRSYLLRDLPAVLAGVDPGRDTWISQAEFIKPNRRIVNLKILALCFADLDTYNLGSGTYAPDDPELWAERVVHYCGVEGIPPPSYIISSGRGLQCKFIFDKPIPRQALPRWNAVQKELVNKLKLFGADLNSRDASRVLRVLKTQNTKSNTTVRPVWINGSAQAPKAYNFEALAAALLPYTREELAEKRAQAQAKRAKRAVPSFGRHLSIYSLWWARLEDMRTLIRLRGGIAEGKREIFLFWMIVAMLWSRTIGPENMYAEALELAKEVNPNYDWEREDGPSSLASLYRRAVRYAAGEMDEWNGQKVPALYRAKNQTLIDYFAITDSEMVQLSSILTPSEVSRRDREQQIINRRWLGQVDRASYLDGFIGQVKPWDEVGVSRRTWFRGLSGR